ncbi:MAG: hypothetical protein WAZ21_03560 [Candidatus Saccharimonadales bacterium]
MQSLNITASTQFAIELVRAALPVVAKRHSHLHGAWEHVSVKMGDEVSNYRIGRLHVAFHSGVKVHAQCRVFKSDENIWNQGTITIILPDKSKWEANGTLKTRGAIEIDKDSVVELKI